MAIDLQDIAGTTLISDLPAILNSNNTKIKNHFKTTIKTVNGKTPDANGDVVVSAGGTATDLSQYYTKSESDAKYLTEHQDISGKQDVISDLAAIRSGAALGATALQSVPTGYATQTWVNQQNFLKEHQSLTGYATQTWVNQQGFLTQHQSLSGYATESFVTGKGYITSSALANISSTSVTTTNLTINGWAVTIV